MTNAPIVMKPVFSQAAAIASLIAFIVSLAGCIAALPNSLLVSAHINPTVIAQVQLLCMIIVGVTGGHLATTRSLLPSVDDPK